MQADRPSPSAADAYYYQQQQAQYGRVGASPSAGAGYPTDLAGLGGGGGDEYRRTAAEVFKDAHDVSASLKQLLVSQPPWSRDVEAERTRARNLYLVLLFHHPLSTYAQSIDHLWLNTSYTLIAAYRDAIARLEPPPTPAPGGGRRKGGGGGNDQRSVDLRKTLTRFRQALGSEETYYRSLITRIVGFYQLQRATRPHLAVLGIAVPDPVQIQDRDGVPVSGTEYGLAPVLSREESEKKVGLVYKGLICLGDIERYKEQYSERARREAREGVKDRSVRDSERYARAKSYYEVARGLQPDNGSASNQMAVVSGYLSDHFVCVYHYFRALAVRQPFPSGEANLERALKKVFDKWRAKRQQETEKSGEEGEAGSEGVEAFKRHFVVILAILFARAGTSHLGQLQSSALPLLAQLMAARTLPSEVIVKATAMAIGSHWHARLSASTPAPTTTDSDAEQPRHHASGPEDVRQPKPRKSVEDLSLNFLLSFFGVLLRVSNDEVEDALAAASSGSAIETDPAQGLGTSLDPPANLEHELELATHISAVLRRILPSLRIMSRWTKSHLEYLSRCARSPNSELVWAVDEFWARYKQLMLGFARLFPLGQMPALDEPLEEDIDMRGFLPLRRGLTEPVPGAANGGQISGDGLDARETGFSGDNGDVVGSLHREVHPNEEQLMRIADLLVDVKLLMQTEAGSLALKISPLTSAPGTSGPFAAPSLSLGLPAPGFPTQSQPLTDERDREIDPDLASVSTETEDDPVNLAMRATLGEGSSVGEMEEPGLGDDSDEGDLDDDEEEVILWGRNTPPVIGPPPTHYPPAHEMLHSLALSHDTTRGVVPSHSYSGPPPALSHPGMPTVPAPGPHHTAHAPPAPVAGGPAAGTAPGVAPGSSSPQLLFGAGGDFSGGSIWAMSRAESQPQSGMKRQAPQPPHSAQPQSQPPQQGQQTPVQAQFQPLNQGAPLHPSQFLTYQGQSQTPHPPHQHGFHPATAASTQPHPPTRGQQPIAPIAAIWNTNPHLGSPSSPGLGPAPSPGAGGGGIWGQTASSTLPGPPMGGAGSSSAGSSGQPVGQQHAPRTHSHVHLGSHSHPHSPSGSGSGHPRGYQP